MRKKLIYQIRRNIGIFVSSSSLTNSAFRWLLFALLAPGLVTSCGYRLAGRGKLPGNLRTIAVRILENRSSESGIETVITNALINELNRRRRGTVVSLEQADAVLAGTIESITWDTLSRSGVNTATQRRVYGTISLTLTDRSGSVLWKRSGLSGEQAYTVLNNNRSATEFNRRQAISMLAERVAETVYRRLTDNF